LSDDLQPTGASRDLPILRAALRRADSSNDLPDVQDLERDTGLKKDQVWIGLRALQSADPPYIELDAGTVMAVSERARRELGTWPSPASLVDELAAALALAADKEIEPERKSRLRAAADGLAGMARDIAVGVIARRIGDL